jgi:hypothetical protein
VAGHIATAKNTNWTTPLGVVQCVRECLGAIMLDPCSNAESVVGAAHTYDGSPGQDGLAESWDYPTIYCNPPFGRGINVWLALCCGASWQGSQVVALIPAAVGAKYFHHWVWKSAQAVCFPEGRLRFGGLADGGKNVAPMDCCLPYWGNRVDRFEYAFRDLGKVVRL